MKRRRFLRALTAGMALLGVAALPFGIARLLAPAEGKRTTRRIDISAKISARRNHLLPPGALKDESAFTAACIGCGLCGEVCPLRCIKFHKRGGGGKVNTPYIDPTEKACILCDKCMQACPTEALTVTRRREIDMGIARIDRTACYPWVDRGICGACVSICPEGKSAIAYKQWNQYKPVIKDGCVGCGLCVEVCPHPSVPIWIVDRQDATGLKQGV
ncbi:MAG: 4Fe-4S dicluster domain-containing protein [Rhodospirillales bacterium]|jgi:ferredoxin-type protein NapG|nr:4Fe-4S dicluster domain-containing protein [Rhodospirillales bacterium]